MSRRTASLVLLALGLAGCSDDPRAPVVPTGPRQLNSASPAAKPVPDQYIVVFKDGVNNVRELSAKLVAANSGTLLSVYEHAGKGFAAALPRPAIEALRRHPQVAYVEQNVTVQLDDHVSQSLSAQNWGLDRIDQRPLSRNYTYSYNRTGAGVNAYIIDSGIRITHQQFGGRARYALNAVPDGRSANDCNGHGTHVAGTVGGADFAVAKGVTLHAVRIADCNGNTQTNWVLDAIEWVRVNHVKPAVVNLSFSFPPSNSIDTWSQNTVNAGVTFVTSAGNNADDACGYSPNRVPDLLTVGATTSSDSRASFSAWGTCVDIFAPGDNIVSGWIGSDSDYKTLSGTSMSAPHVAGVAALILQSYPSASPSTVWQIMRNHATSGVLGNLGSGSPNLLLYSLYDETHSALSVGLSGPSYLTQEGEYTYEALPTGGNGSYTYQWEVYWERQNALVRLGTGRTQSVYVTADHGPFEMRAIVQSAGSTEVGRLAVCNDIYPNPPGCWP